jgi:plasmid stabilization system protein ParE
MVREIIWSDKAIITYNNIITYLENNWPDRVTNGFVIKVKRTLQLLSTGKIKFRQSSRRKCFEVLITKQNLLVYKIKHDTIELIMFFDTRQHPRKKKF